MVRRRMFQGLMLALLAIFMLPVYARNTILVFDVAPTDVYHATSLPIHFRSSEHPIPTPDHTSMEGLRKLHMLGSGQFSANQLYEVLRKFNKKITLVDLRQESHGFINGIPVSLYAKYNLGNIGKSDEEIKQSENAWLASIAKLKKIVVSHLLKKTATLDIEATDPVTLKVLSVHAESQLAELYSLGYKRIYVADGAAPTMEQVRQFLRLVKETPKDTWLYFHCRGGEGRTTTFMVMYDMLFNAKKVSFHDILQREMLLGGKDLTRLSRPNALHRELAKERLQFLKHFYKYCRDGKVEELERGVMPNEKQ